MKRSLSRDVRLHDRLVVMRAARRGVVGEVVGIRVGARMHVEWEDGVVGWIERDYVHGNPSLKQGYLLLGRERTRSAA